MKQLLFTLLLLLGFAIPPSVKSTELPIIFSSVRLLVVHTKEGVNRCTTGLVGNEWLTAFHCVDGFERGWIGGVPVRVYRQDKKKDLALLLLEGITNARPLKLAAEEPEVGDVVMSAHFQFSTGPQYGIGIVSATQISWEGSDYLFHTIPTCVGSSGAPIVNAHNELVSVVLGTTKMCSTPWVGATFKAVRSFLSKKE